MRGIKGEFYKKQMKRKEIERLFRQHYAKMYRVARTLLYDEQESEDVVSDIFENLLNGKTVLLPKDEEAYLMTSVRNMCFKRLRHEEVKRNSQSLIAMEQEDEDEDERLADIIEFVVAHLSAQEQRIFHLRFTDGNSYEEIALSEGISKVAVWKHISHLINEIKNHFYPHTL